MRELDVSHFFLSFLHIYNKIDTNFTISLVLFLVFFRYQDATVPQDELAGESPKWQVATLVGVSAFVHGLLVVILTGVFAIARPNYLNSWANFLGVMATSLAVIQYFPQIWTTYHLKHAGSLSIPMMCIQTPGGFLFATSLFFRLGWKGWSTWSIFVVTAAMQGVVLGMCIYYEIAARRASRLESSHGGNDQDASANRTQHQDRPIANRTYSEGWERGLPGPFTGHPERYAETEEDLEDIQDREERAIARESQPLLKPGGIGNPIKSYDSTQ